MEIYSSQRRSINDRALQDVDMVLDDGIDNVASRLRWKALLEATFQKCIRVKWEIFVIF